MARKSAASEDEDPVTDNLDGAPDWYIREWAAFRGVTQADLSRKCGWTKGRASQIWNGKTEYYRGIVIEAARALDAAPYELMMPPAQAMALREFYSSARQLAAENNAPFRSPPRAPASRFDRDDDDG